MSLISLIIALAFAGIGAAVAYFLPNVRRIDLSGASQRELEVAQHEAKEIQHEAKETIRAMEKVFEEEEKTLQEAVARLEEVVSQKEKFFEKREARHKEQEAEATQLSKTLDELGTAYKKLQQSKTEKLAKTAKLTPEKALESAKKEIEGLVSENKEARHAAELEEMEDEIVKSAKAVLQIVIQRLSVSSSVDKNNTQVFVKHDNFKGMLIGKEGRNIQYLESLLPVSVIFNHGGDPQIINVAGVNLIRRHIAKRAINRMQQLVQKGETLDHDMIKKTVEEAEADVMKECDEKGKVALKTVGLDPATTHEEVINHMGRLYFRTSYGQNQMFHSIEAGYAARMIAELIGVDITKAQTAAFYHDLGKSIDHDTGGSHDEISAEILERHHYDPEVVYAALIHHGKGPDKTPTDFIVKAADAISGARPGARMESVTNYFERMKELENIANGFEGVSKVFTMSAGREVRVMLNNERVLEASMQNMADSIAEKISEEVAFPGIIKVNLIRQTKSVDYAREQKRAR